MPLVTAGQRVTAGTESLCYAQTDTQAITVTAAALTDITKGWTILGGDANIGTAYRLTTWGYGVWQASQTLQFATYFGGGSIGTDPLIGATEFNGSAAFRWTFTAILHCKTTGTSGTWNSATTLAMSSTASTILSGTVGNNATIAGAGGTLSDYTKDTTVLETFKLQVGWSATTGGPTITSRGSLFERLGG